MKGLIASNWFTGPDFPWHEKFPSGDIKVRETPAKDPYLCKTFVLKSLTAEDTLLSHFTKFSSWTRLLKRERKQNLLYTLEALSKGKPFLRKLKPSEKEGDDNKG